MQRPRTRSRRNMRPLTVPSTLANTGPLAAAAWLGERGLLPTERHWFVEIALAPEGDALFVPDSEATLFQLEIYQEEWGFRFMHAGRASWIRVTDVRFVHGRDDHDLVRETPSLGDIGTLVRALERRYSIELVREPRFVRTNLTGAEAIIRAWAATL